MVIDKDNIKILLIILVLGLGIGYAYINSDLNINGTAQVNSANWDVHWANIAVTSGSVSGSNVVTQPTISNQTTVNYSVILSKPGDYYEFCVDAVNGGAMDAMIDGIDSKLNGSTITTLPAYLNYSVTYSDGIELEPNHELLANTTEKYKIRLEYSTDITENQLPTANQTLNLQFTVTYRQANNNSIPVPRVYTVNLYDPNAVNDNYIYMNQAIPSWITQYSRASDALAAIRLASGINDIPFYLKHKISGGVVTETYVECIVTSAMAQSNSGMTPGTYSLRGGINETQISPKPLYESNKETLLSAFGNSNCEDYSDIFNNVGLQCTTSNLYAELYSNGNVYIYQNHWYCGIDGGGSSNCGDSSL